MAALLHGAWDWWSEVWPYLVAALDLAISLVTSGHAVLYKRDARSTIAWVGFIWLVPFLGALLYVLLGINRIRRRARSLRADRPHPKLPLSPFECPASELPQMLGPAAHLASLAEVATSATGRPLLRGNRITPLHNGRRGVPRHDRGDRRGS